MGTVPSSYTVHRYKLWQGVGEDLDYPLYGGQIIAATFAFEIWTVEGEETASLLEAIQVITSLLYDPEDCCDDDMVDAGTLEPYCELFSLLPAGGGQPLFTEDGDEILTEGGEPILTE